MRESVGSEIRASSAHRRAEFRRDRKVKIGLIVASAMIARTSGDRASSRHRNLKESEISFGISLNRKAGGSVGGMTGQFSSVGGMGGGTRTTSPVSGS